MAGQRKWKFSGRRERNEEKKRGRNEEEKDEKSSGRERRRFPCGDILENERGRKGGKKRRCSVNGEC